MMAEMLTYIESKSHTYIVEQTGVKTFPDENYAREIMQLFSIGIPMLNLDGTLQLDDDGVPLKSYDNNDVQNFARVWTGFTRQEVRGNYESMSTEWLNRMDPMKIEGSWRDPFPKMVSTSSLIMSIFLYEART